MVEWGVNSEVGELRTVLVHRPGYEHRRTMPWNKDALLFDDVLDVEEARPEHQQFTSIMQSAGIRVIFLMDLLKDVCADPTICKEVYSEVLDSSLIKKIDFSHFRAENLVMGYPNHFSLKNDTVLEPLPNMYFTRDPAFAVPGAVVISNPRKPARRRESRLVSAIFKHHPLFHEMKIFTEILDSPEAFIEGGDVHVIDPKTVLVGVGERTNNLGADMLAHFLFTQTTVERVLKLFIPAKREFMHLDTVMTFVDRKKILTLPYIWERPDIYAAVAERSQMQCRDLGFEYTGPSPEAMREPSKLVELTRKGEGRTFHNALEGLIELNLIDESQTVTVAGPPKFYHQPEDHIIEALREQWNDGANVLALKPGQVMSYTRNDRTFRALEEEGVEVLTFKGSELVRGRGGARCMSMPLIRSGI